MKFDAIVIGGGWSGAKAALELLKSGREVALFMSGRPVYKVDLSEFKSLGGLVVAGDKVTGGRIEDGKVVSVTTEDLGTVCADVYVLATGKFFGGGLVADMDKVYEPVFGLDVEYEKDRSKWFDPDFFADQPFLNFGVKADAEGHPYKDGTCISNLTVTGGILASKQ